MFERVATLGDRHLEGPTQGFSIDQGVVPSGPGLWAPLENGRSRHKDRSTPQSSLISAMVASQGKLPRRHPDVRLDVERRPFRPRPVQAPLSLSSERCDFGAVATEPAWRRKWSNNTSAHTAPTTLRTRVDSTLLRSISICLSFGLRTTQVLPRSPAASDRSSDVWLWKCSEMQFSEPGLCSNELLRYISSPSRDLERSS